MKLYHFIPNEHLEFVKKHRVLFSSAQMLDACGWGKCKEEKRKCCITLPSGITMPDGTTLPDNIKLRDQGKLDEEEIVFFHDFGMTDLVELLNKHVFFWHRFPKKFAKKYSGDALIRCALADVENSNRDNPAFYCPFNSGAPKSDCDDNKALRSPYMYQPLDIQCVSAEAIEEVVFRGNVKLPDKCDFMSPDKWQKKFL